MLSLIDVIYDLKWTVLTSDEISDENIKERLFYYCSKIDDSRLQQLCVDIWSERESFWNKPASMQHHTDPLGLVKHSIQTADYALALKAIVDPKDKMSRDLILTGALLHDVGKSLVGDMSKPDIGGTSHIDLGVELITSHFKDFDFTDKERVQLINIIDVHHTPFAHGTKKPFFTVEAYIVNLADSLSATFDCIIPQLNGDDKIKFYDHQFLRKSVFK